MEYTVNFGRLGKSAPAKPGAAFRLALLGDFSGRANAGIVETGDALARRKPHRADVDSLDGLLGKLLPKLVLPLDGLQNGSARGIAVPLGSLDDLHPDQLVETVPLLEELLTLRRNLQGRGTWERASKEVLSWAGEDALPRQRRRARGAAVATNSKLSDFARLTGRKPAKEADADEAVSLLMRRLVGPHVVPSRDSRQDALVARVDAALSDATRRILHHPDFQAAEALWRSVEFLVRRLETGTRLQIVLYDVPAEELAADLAAQDDLKASGLYKLLVEQPALDAHQGPLSFVAGLYGFEAAPPHADLLGRVAQVAGAAGAPFVADIGPRELLVPPVDWHPLTRQAWDALRALPASAYLGLVSPRFLLRMPYGKRTDPVDAFAFEEFTRQDGLSGMLWGNGAVLAAYCAAQAWAKGGTGMQLGSVATVGDLPVYVYQDTDGEQVALPCTDRLFTERQAGLVSQCGVIPVVSLRGRPEVRVAGFGSVAGVPLAGRWAPVAVQPASPPAAAPVPGGPPAAASPAAAAPTAAAPAVEEEPDTSELDALLAGLEASAAQAQASEARPEAGAPAPPAQAGQAAQPAQAQAAPAGTATADDAASATDELDALLASLSEEPPPPDPDSMDADLDALLASLNA